MGPGPAPTSVILAIPVPPPPSNPSSPSSNQDPPTQVSDLSSSPSDPACPPPVLASTLSGSALASSASPAIQDQLSRRDLPADLLCFQHLSSPSSSFEPPSAPQFPAAPEPPPAAPTVSAAPSSPAIPPLSSSLAAQPAVPLHRTQPVRRNASATSVSEPPSAVPPETAALPSSAFPPLSSSLPKCPHHADAPLPAQSSDLQHRTPPVRHNAQANPLHPKSYAQAAKGSLGPGFVRAHARDVDSFARLPRTGINIICGSHEGIPACSIVQSDLPKVEGLYAKALIMKFHGGRPSLAVSHKEISSWGFESPFSIGPLTSRSFLLRFQEERDLLKILTRPSTTLINFPYKIFRWHNRCHMKEDSCMVPIWISLPRLPLQCFAPEYLESFASLIGRFLCLDKATATLARPSEARMCIEIDLRKERPQFIWIGLFEGFKQRIIYERVPKFCMGCHMQGHTYVVCSKNTLDTLQSKDSGPIPAYQECSQAVRRNAKESSDSVSHVIPDQSRDSSFAAVSALLSASDFPLQETPRSPSAAASSEHQLCDPLPHPPPPSQPMLPAAAQQLPAVQPLLQSTVAAATHPLPAAAVSNFASVLHPSSAPPLSSEVQQAGSPSEHPPDAVPSAVLSVQTAPFPPADPVQPSQQTSPHYLQSTVAAATNPPLTPPPSQQLPAVRPNLQSTAASVAAVSHMTAPTHLSAVHQILQSTAAAESHPPHPPPQSKAVASPSSQLPPDAPPFLPVYINSNGATYITSLPQKSLPIGYAPNPSFTHHQRRAFEGYDSENSFETDSQPNSPLESPKDVANRCPLPPQSYASEGEQPTEDQPGFQGHISDGEFYHQPISSKKNKRQPDGPLRVKLRTRKGISLHR